MMDHFSAVEHIVPHSLGNDILVLAVGWVCDKCNNICSRFESKVLSTSILGVERCRLGVMTKKRKPAKAEVYGVTWCSMPDAPKNQVLVEASWDDTPVRLSLDGRTGKIPFPVHDNSCYAIARLLLKIGIEIISPHCVNNPDIYHELHHSKQYVIGKNNSSWPYFLILDGDIEKHLVSAFASLPETHEYIISCGFDAFLHQIEDEIILFFSYGNFRAGISLSSRDTKWVEIFSIWNISYVGCPINYSKLHS